ncbi:WD repeat and HMG-box DNA-binding protein 1 [Strongyloides ratti]|uniref:WD repeat and HMG-box DNA-binding protein 1 n=1 Tax=Strongyloides ratti TaxID=34506 RepID=A0A090LFJ0_STRRB|nr:WD repeat and HMG-box DNA-binding protein 1 [Strongyloides ratti]CEF66235.1 WD repeat and HMG-box DNA-binding protein 1 [Strongyloides ratti]
MDAFETVHAHFRGPIKIALNKDHNSSMNPKENLFVSIGSDSSIFYWSLDSKNKLQYREEICTNDNVSCICWWNKNIYLGQTSRDPITENEQNYVTSVEYGKAIVNGTMTKFSLETCALDCSHDGRYIVAASNDFVIKSIQLDEKSEVLKYDKYCTDDPIVSISVDPTGVYFAAAFSNSNVNIYRLNAEKDVCGQQKLDPLAKFSFSNKQFLSRGDILYSMTWSKNGEFLYLPTDNGVKVITYLSKSNSFVEECKWNSDVNENFNNCCISNKGDKLAVSSIDGTIIVFDTNNGKCISESYKPTTGITSLAWSPLEEQENVLIVCDTDEKTYLHTVKINNISVSPNSNNVVKRKVVVSDDECDVMDCDDEATNFSYDLGKIKSTYALPEDDNIVEESYVPERIIKYKPPKILPPFMVTSTPKTTVGCFLKWNNHGIIKLICDDNESRIEASFHDISIHGEIIIDNTYTNFTMGDISNKAVVLASPRNGKKTPSKLFVKYFSSWDGNSRDWELEFEDSDESIVNISLSDNYIAVATSYKFIRIYTLAGIQLNVFCYNGPLVTMIMNDDVLVVVRYDGGAMFTGEKDEKGNSCMEYSLKMDFHFISTIKCTKTFPVSLTPYSNLQFITFTPDSNIVTMDSKYNFYVFHIESTTWLPIKRGSDLITNNLDSIFPIFVTFSSAYQIRYLYVANGQYPLVTHKSTVQVTTFEFPLIGKSTDRYLLENQILLNKYFPSMKYTLNGTTTTKAGILLRLFALATTTKRLVRATDIAKMADEEKIIQALSNYAAKQNFTILSEKVNEIGKEIIEKKRNEKENKHVRFEDNGWSDDEKITLNTGNINPKSKISTPTIIAVPKRKYPNTPIVNSRNMINHDDSLLEVESDIKKQKKDDSSSQLSTTSEMPEIGRLYSVNPFKKNVDSTPGNSQVFKFI